MAMAIGLILVLWGIAGFVDPVDLSQGVAGVLLGAILLWFSMREEEGSNNIEIGSSKADRSALKGLSDHWAAIKKLEGTDNNPLVRRWYFDEPSEAQLDKLDSLKVKLGSSTKARLTKGQVSDLIGLHYPAGDEDVEVLDFFDVAYDQDDLSETMARVRSRELLMDKKNLKRWSD